MGTFATDTVQYEGRAAWGRAAVALSTGLTGVLTYYSLVNPLLRPATAQNDTAAIFWGAVFVLISALVRALLQLFKAGPGRRIPSLIALGVTALTALAIGMLFGAPLQALVAGLILSFGAIGQDLITLDSPQKKSDPQESAKAQS
jgi:hypothetical protein